ncbi:hypothetical protein MARCHEWKA_03070 [Brevundimonas phage vB_BpoS-Marchewka]|uniref:Uncharacterized protein n=1 Tax=Brevundimonas phage vB_BpoS-Marchewka TaxID=2948604 RepID=A0A9E7SR66_9CAUD|nr:hypothetical protein MARCHEWKA_03070 [Brevundimonas phage vB_BpoS-Marchewka]UTC29266.1 hypothetical protein BAMBUS_01840 [Brevundimonas phage vB_BpoS-Bambus]
MNLLDPTHITPEVLRRAFALYGDSVHPAHAPHVWEEDDHDIGLDGRFNLSLLGRYIEECYRLDCVARLKPTASAEEIEIVIRLYVASERSGVEFDRFVRAMKCALDLKRHEVEALVKAVGQKVCTENTIEIARDISEWRRAEKEARRRPKVSQDG